MNIYFNSFIFKMNRWVFYKRSVLLLFYLWFWMCYLHVHHGGTAPWSHSTHRKKQKQGDADRVKSKALFLKEYNTKAKNFSLLSTSESSLWNSSSKNHGYATRPVTSSKRGGLPELALERQVAGAAAAGPSCHRWPILRWLGRRPSQWCYWTAPESLLVSGWRRWLSCTSSCLSDDWKD